MKEAIKLKRRGKLSTGVLLLRITHPFTLFRLQLLTPNFFQFPKIKSHLRGRCFENNDQALCAVEEFFENQDTTFFCNEIEMLEHRRQNVKRDYIEK